MYKFFIDQPVEFESTTFLVSYEVDYQSPDYTCTDSDVDYYGYTDITIFNIKMGYSHPMEDYTLTNFDVESLGLWEVDSYGELEERIKEHLVYNQDYWNGMEEYV